MSQAECDEPIAGLNDAIAERNIQIGALVNSWPSNLTRPLRRMNSNSKRIASLARRLWQQPFGRTVHLFGTFARASTSHGIRYALSRARAHLREAEDPVSVQGMTLSNQERYLMEKSAQNNYLTNSLANSTESPHFDWVRER
jgi:hypothetical protein